MLGLCLGLGLKAEIFGLDLGHGLGVQGLGHRFGVQGLGLGLTLRWKPMTCCACSMWSMDLFSLSLTSFSCLWNLYSVGGYVLSLTVTFVSRMSQQTDSAGESFLWPAHSFGTSCRLPHGYQHQHIGLVQAIAEDVPVSMSGRLVAADTTSEEQFWGIYSKAYNTVALFLHESPVWRTSHTLTDGLTEVCMFA